MVAPLVPVTVAFLIGILLAWYWTFVLPGLVGVGVLSVCLVCLCWRRLPRVSLVTLLVLWMGVGWLRTVSWLDKPVSHVAFAVQPDPAPVIVHGVVVDDPTELLSPNEPARQACVVHVRHVRTDDGWRAATGLIRARLREPRVKLAYGDEVVLEGRWSAVPSPGNPGQYDWKAALARQRIHALVSVEPYQGVVRLASGQGQPWFGIISALRRRLETAINAHFHEDHAGLLRSFLLGQRVALDEDLKWAFVETGTMHLVVISGFNVGLIAGLLELLLRIIGWSLRPRLVCSAVALFGYCVLTGMQPPVTRATIMAWIVLGAIGLDRVINWPNTLAAAALAILWLHPAQLFDPGFQLSFGAVLSLLVFTKRFRALLEPLLRIQPDWLQRYVAISVASTVAIWVGIWPLLAWYFHLISPVSVLANLVLVPLVSLLVGMGTLVLMAGAIAQPVVSLAAPALAWLVDLIVGCVHWFHQVPWGYWLVGHPSWLVIGGYYALVTLSLSRRPLRLNLVWVLASWLIGLNVWLWGMAAVQAARARWLEITVLDVGHGDSLVVRAPSRHTLLIDAGTDEAGRYTVVPFLRVQGIQALDALILTHFDADHAGGALAVLRHAHVRRLFTNGSRALTPTAHHVLALAEATRVPHERLAAGMRVTGASGLDMIVLHPPARFVPATEPSSNDNSLVMQVTKGHTSLLLCGDLEERGVPWLLRWDQRLRSTVLKVPHHGSALGPWGRALVEQVRPSTAVISVGRLHRLPAAAVLHDLEAVGAKTLLTRHAGAITIRTDGTRLLVDTYRNVRR